MEKVFSVLLGCFGDYPQYSIRAARSVLAATDKRFDFLVGCNVCCAETVQFLREKTDATQIDALVESKQNLNKDPMMRILLAMVRTPFVLWMDDDSHLSGDWDAILEKFIKNQSFDCAGHIFFYHKDEEYKQFLHKRPWWRGEQFYLEPNRAKTVWFATGGLFLIRTEILRRHNFPDPAMIKRQDDLLLGDLISQWQYKLINFPREFMNVIRISDGKRRGGGEGRDGWIV